eukprot:SAG31_NODE_7058_length_1800_cov_122.113463_1_plen_199_part_00
MLSLYQRELQDNVKYYKEFEDNLKNIGWKPDEDSPHETLEDFIKWMYDDSERKIKERWNKAENKKYKWIGINPYPLIENIEECELKIKQLYNLLKSKCITTCWLQQCAWTVEAFTESGMRPHIHMIVITNVRPSRIIEQFSKTFKCEKNMIEVNSMTFGYEDKLKYLNGIKKETKMPLVLNDKELRDKLEIPHIYNTL